MKVMKRYILALTVLASGGLAFAQSGSEATDSVNQEQSQTVVKALFEYPVAPAEITGLQEKSDWLMEHFWDGFNPKKLKSVDQSALNHAFFVYATPMQWADKEKSIASVDRLIESLKKNPALMLQMTKAAEETLYGPRATMWIDEIYVRFLEALVKQKKLKDFHKARYQFQLDRLKGSMEGSVAPDFSFVKPDGTPARFTPTGNYTLIEFGDPDCYDCTMAKLKLDTDAKVSDLLRTGRLNICFIIPGMDEGWQEQLKDYPEKWVVGASEDVDEIYDIRLTPTFYIIGPAHKIQYKNLPLDRVVSILKAIE